MGFFCKNKKVEMNFPHTVYVNHTRKNNKKDKMSFSLSLKSESLSFDFLN